MKQIYLFTIVCMFWSCFVGAQDTFYKEYQFALDTDLERRVSFFNIDDTLRLITLREGSAVGINVSLIDLDGNVISTIYHDGITFFEEAILYDEDREEFIFDGLSRSDLPRKNCIFKMDKYGNILESKCNQYALPDDNELGDVDNALHIVKTDFGYVVSGGEFTENNRFGFINFYDHDLNLTFSDTLSKYRYIGNITNDGQGGINALGIVAITNVILGGLDSIMFLKINQLGEITNQVRIPHSEIIPTTNGHYHFITDTMTGASYLYDFYDFDTTSSTNVQPRVTKLDQDGNVIWEFNDWQSYDELNDGASIYQRKDGSLIIHGSTGLNDPTTNRNLNTIKMVSIDQDGNFLWQKTYYDLYTTETDIVRKILVSVGMTEDSSGHIYSAALGAIPIEGLDVVKPHLIKLNADGCYTSDCKPITSIGDYHKPNNLVTERNEIHIYNKDTEESYRYTFYPKDDLEHSGELLKSNSMSGDDWESTGRNFSGRAVLGLAPKTFVREQFNPTAPYPEIFIDWHYHFAYEIGDSLRLEDVLTGELDYLEVMDIEEITLLDGRTKDKFTLSCTNLDPDGNPYPDRIWIEDIGDINDFLNTSYACTSPGNEVITCFFSDGDLIWRHPDYDLCTVDTEDNIVDHKLIIPNPAINYLEVQVALASFEIIGIDGKIYLSATNIQKHENVDISLLASGTYIVKGRDTNGQAVITRFVKL